MGYQNAEDLVDAIKLVEGDPFLKLLEIAWHQQQERNSAKH